MEAIERLRHEGALFHDERVVERFGKVAHLALEVAEVDDHVLHRALALQFGDLQVHHHAPPMPMQVLALAMVVGKEMRRIEFNFGFQPVHEAPLVGLASSIRQGALMGFRKRKRSTLVPL